MPELLDNPAQRGEPENSTPKPSSSASRAPRAASLTSDIHRTTSDNLPFSSQPAEGVQIGVRAQ